MKLNLSDKPEIVTLEKAPFVYVEKIGPFMVQAPLAWQEFWSIAGSEFEKKSIVAMMGLSRIDEAKKGDEAFVYQAGISVKSLPSRLSHGLLKRELPGGKFARFLLTGSYTQLADAYPRAFSILEEMKLGLRDEFCAECYLNSPIDTSEDDLKTEILIPVL